MNQLTLVPEGGLSNRIIAITSAISFVEKHNIRLKVIWIKDWGMGAGFYDLFTLSSDIEHVTIKDAGFWDFFKFKKPIKSNFFLPKLYQALNFDAIYYWYKEQISVEEWYLSHPEASAFFLYHCQRFFDSKYLFNVLLPVNVIQKRIDEQKKLLSPHTIGLHIRRTDLTTAIRNSPLSVFIEKMYKEIALNPETDFYVASDSIEEKKKLKALFGDRIITVDYNLKRNSKNGIIDALIELHTLASTKKIYGSFSSTYSILASEIRKITIEILQI